MGDVAGARGLAHPRRTSTLTDELRFNGDVFDEAPPIAHPVSNRHAAPYFDHQLSERQCLSLAFDATGLVDEHLDEIHFAFGYHRHSSQGWFNGCQAADDDRHRRLVLCARARQ